MFSPEEIRDLFRSDHQLLEIYRRVRRRVSWKEVIRNREAGPLCFNDT